MNVLHYFNFNNYLNRVIKGYDTLQEYINNADYLGNSGAVNFNKKSELEANVVCFLDSYTSPDYVILTSENNAIISRWFVINETRNNKNNYQLNLRRDIIFDNLNIIMNNENTLIQKGFAENASDAILNSEDNYSFNEYKRAEFKILDNNTKQNNGWLAIFITNNQKMEIDTNDNVNVYKAFFTSEANANITEDYKTLNATLDITDNQIYYKGLKGYSIILVPWLIFKEFNTYKNYVLNYYSDGNLIETVTYKKDGYTSTRSLVTATAEQLVTFIVQQIVPNTEVFVDMQIIPEISGYDYEINKQKIDIKRKGTQADKEHTLNNIIVDSPKFASCLFVNEVVNGLYYTDIDTKIIIEKDYKDLTSVKLLEAYKTYLQSPDRSSNAQIDLRKFIQRSNGTLTYDKITFITQYQYQPYQSYIYIYPYVQGSYYDLNIQDGEYLICGYNNQLLRTSDAWISFLLNNKNYLNNFNLQMRDAKINAVTGTLTAGIKGATSGAIASGGNPIAAGVSGAVSMVTSAIESAVNIDEMKKTFKWSCDNMQSKPQSLSKVATFTPSNAIYPVLTLYYNDNIINGEFEKYLKFNGMTINKIGKPKEYIKKSKGYNYLSATIIKLDEFKGTAEELQEIKKELSIGLIFE